MDTQPMQWHPIACMFPMLSENELFDLVKDIEKHGQLGCMTLLSGIYHA